SGRTPPYHAVPPLTLSSVSGRDQVTPYEVREFRSWNALLDYQRARRWNGWAFRGQGSEAWTLCSSLERVVVGRFGRRRAVLDECEVRLTRRFQRQAHRFLHVPPRYNDRLEWLATMQHHGAPTRLLDWTYSFYVAALFALESCNLDDRCAIWALSF